MPMTLFILKALKCRGAEQILESKSKQTQSYKTFAQRIDTYVLNQIGVPDLILANTYKVNWIMT